MNKKWKWGLSLACAAALLSGASIGLVACSDKNNNNNNQQEVEPEKQLYTPPEEVNIGDNFLFNLRGSNFEATYLKPSPINKGELEGSCVFQDEDQTSPTHNGWYNLILDNSDPKNQKIFANFLGYNEYDFPTGPQAQMKFPSEVKIPSSINLIYTKDEITKTINSVPIAGFNLFFPVKDAEKYISIFPFG